LEEENQLKVLEHSAEENMWSFEGETKMRVEKTAC
jgi:hypothetical protein